VRQLRELALERGVEISIAADLPEVRINAAAVELCLSNYLGNAIKYSDPHKRERWAEVRAYIRPRPAQKAVKELVVEVRDNGIGVPEPSRARLFERFFRVTSEKHTDVKGTGLGLSIVRDAVESLDGSAWAEHRDDGSVFAFSLPLSRAQFTPREDSERAA
jgi:two-component system sensor histidine kinase KdpD